MPAYQNPGIVWNPAFLAKVAGAYSVVPGAALFGAAPKVRLSKDPTFNPNKNNVLADFTAGEADYTGYTVGGIAAVPSGLVNLGGAANGVIVPGLFVGGAAFATPNTLYGVWIDDGTIWIAGHAFTVLGGIQIGATGDYLDLILALANQFSQSTQ